MPAGTFCSLLLATISRLTGRSRRGKRPALAILADLPGLLVSTGMVSKAGRRAEAATTQPVAEVARAVASPPPLNGDLTGWRQCRKRVWRWAAVGPGMMLFRVDRSRGADALQRLVGEAIAPVITSDRFATSKRASRRQICWAHLRREYQAMIDRAAGGLKIGAKLLALSVRVFDWWRRLGLGAIRRSTLRAYLGWLRPVVRLNLEAGPDGPCRWTAKVCRQLLLIEASLWTFAAPFTAGSWEMQVSVASRTSGLHPTYQRIRSNQIVPGV